MKEQQVEEAELRRYLLGELTPEERVLIEERMFLDSAYMQLAWAVEDELVDDYVNQELTPAEREKFELDFLARPQHRDDLRIAQALKRYLASESESANAEPESLVSHAGSSGQARTFKETGWSFLPSLLGRKAILSLSFAAALIVLSVVAWLVIGSWRRQQGHPPMQAQDPAPGQQQPQESANATTDNGPSPAAGREVAGRRDGNQPPMTAGGRHGNDPFGRQGGRTPQRTQPPTGQAPTRVAAFVLLPGGGVRGEGLGESVSIAADIGTVVLRLPLVEEDFSSYRATLETGGRVARAFDRLISEVDPELGRVVQIRVPADLLRAQSYQVKLSGITADGRTRSLPSYTFAVERR